VEELQAEGEDKLGIFMERKGEKIGWIGGWIGSFLWLGVLACLLLVNGRTPYGLIGIILFCLAVFLIISFEPSKHPETRYWRLMLPMYVLLALSICFSIYAFGGMRKIGLNAFSFLWIVPLFLPMLTMGSKKWNEKE